MRIRLQNEQHRFAFTLIELLVVIAIIAILMGLLLAGVMRFMVKGPEVTTFNDIRQLDNALGNFQAKFHAKVPPSTIFLSNNYTVQTSNTVGQQTLAYLNSVWTGLGRFWNSTNPMPAGLDWSGGLGMPATGVTLSGDQALVFWLGGIPTKDSSGNFQCLGFATNPQNPTSLSGDRVPPMFEFQSDRLYQRVSGNPFLSYQDAWGLRKGVGVQPYIFFSSNGRRNGYNSSENTLGVTPYFQSQSPKLFLNPNTYQIISSGQNGLFGPGGLWVPAQAYAPGTPGVDDQSNFSSVLLGVPQ